MTVETVTPTEAEQQRAHDLWNAILCNSKVPGWTARGAIAQALAEQRAKYEAVADQFDQYALESWTMSKTCYGYNRQAAGEGWLYKGNAQSAAAHAIRNVAQ